MNVNYVVRLQELDPITYHGGGQALLQPAVKLGIALAVLFISFLSFLEAGRLYTHVVRHCSLTALPVVCTCCAAGLTAI